jgi:hypothetical protein
MSKQGKMVCLICSLLGNLTGVNGIIQMLFRYHAIVDALAIAVFLVNVWVEIVLTPGSLH